jgi:hypothetical protein
MLTWQSREAEAAARVSADLRAASVLPDRRQHSSEQAVLWHSDAACEPVGVSVAATVAHTFDAVMMRCAWSWSLWLPSSMVRPGVGILP